MKAITAINGINSIQLSFICRLCGKIIPESENFHILGGRWSFHTSCYIIAVERLSVLVDIISLPQDEWEKWLADETG